MCAEALPACCLAAVALVRRERRDVRCGCGEWYGYSVETDPAPPPTDAPRPSQPGAAPDRRVQVADEGALRPSSTPPVARLTHVEDTELVDVRRLLTELRPDKGGPLGWAADGAPPSPLGSSWRPAVRIQTSVETPAILPGAFQSSSPVSRAPDFDHGFYGMPDEVRATLRWCQRSGTLAEGLRAFYTACALGLASQEQKDVWKAMPEGVRPAARVVAGRKRVRAAMGAWWGEVDSPTEQSSNAATPTLVTAVDVRPGDGR